MEIKDLVVGETYKVGVGGGEVTRVRVTAIGEKVALGVWYFPGEDPMEMSINSYEVVDFVLATRFEYGPSYRFNSSGALWRMETEYRSDNGEVRVVLRSGDSVITAPVVMGKEWREVSD